MDGKASDSIVTAIGIDIGKNTFHLVGLDERGAIVLRQKLSRGQVTARLATMVPCLIGMEACAGAHHLSRAAPGPRSRREAGAGAVREALSQGPEERLPRRRSRGRGG